MNIDLTWNERIALLSLLVDRSLDKEKVQQWEYIPTGEVVTLNSLMIKLNPRFVEFVDAFDSHKG